MFLQKNERGYTYPLIGVGVIEEERHCCDNK